jgi:hypothetical protein
VVYRKGELSKGGVDSGWPHQVALPACRVNGANYVTIRLFCDDEKLSLCVRGHCFRRDGQDHIVFCFAKREDADRFAQRFGGEPMTPATRPPWIEKRKKL